MRNGLRFIGLAAIAALSLTAMAIQEGIVLKRTSKVGDTAKYRMKAEMDFGGQAATFSGLITEKVTKVADDGQYTVQSTTSEGKVTMNGSEIPGAGDTAETTSTTFKPNGEVVTIISEQSDPNMYRMGNLESLRFPDTALKVGSTWEVNVKKDDKGSVEAKGTYQVLAREKVGTWDCFKIHGTFKESTGADGAGVDATYWVNVADGAMVKLSGTFTNAPFPGAPAAIPSAKVEMNREA